MNTGRRESSFLSKFASHLYGSHRAQADRRWVSIDCSRFPGMSGIRSVPGVEDEWLFVARTALTYVMEEVLMLRPNGARVLVKRIDAPKPKSSLIEIPDTVDGEQSCYAVVLAVGPKVTEDVKVADTVILGPYSGASVKVELAGEEIEASLVMQNDVLAVVEEA